MIFFLRSIRFRTHIIIITKVLLVLLPFNVSIDTRVFWIVGYRTEHEHEHVHIVHCEGSQKCIFLALCSVYLLCLCFTAIRLHRFVKNNKKNSNCTLIKNLTPKIGLFKKLHFCGKKGDPWFNFHPLILLWADTFAWREGTKFQPFRKVHLRASLL